MAARTPPRCAGAAMRRNDGQFSRRPLGWGGADFEIVVTDRKTSPADGKM